MAWYLHDTPLRRLDTSTMCDIYGRIAEGYAVSAAQYGYAFYHTVPLLWLDTSR
jgi:hypothetical protein